jgi:ABC-2 type transport system ATP-binding protein
VVAGHDVAREPRRVRARIGYVAQAAGTDRYLSGRENVQLQARAHGLGRRQAAARAAELLELLGLASAADRLVVTYSGGMRRRIELAMGLVHRPQVLFLDEPTTGLDPDVRSALWAELSRLASDEGLTILLTTHSMEEADRLADRLALVAGGRVVVQGAPAALKRGVGGDTLAVELAGADGDAARRAVDALVQLRDVTLDGGSLRAVAADGPQALPALLGALERGGVAVRAASVSRPTLDDVYLHHAGHAFPRMEPTP